MAISERDVAHIFERLRSGVVPQRGLNLFAVGIQTQRNEIERQLTLAEQREGVFKFLRGGYGCGKTFMARLAALDAQQRGFATSFVVVSDNDLHFHRFDDVYRKVMQELSTTTCPRGALSDILDRWIGRIEDSLIDSGLDEESPDFQEKVQQRMSEELASLTDGKAPEEMKRVLSTIFTLKEQGHFMEAGSLISWLSGSSNIAATAKKQAGVKGDIHSGEALNYLHGILEIVKAAGYKGLVIIIDEVETILRMRRDIRGKSLNGIRQICDVAAQYPGLLWIFTGTPEFFDTKRGVAGLAPLHDRIRFLTHGSYTNPRQPQLEMKPFTRERLREAALKLRQIYPAKDAYELSRKVNEQYIDSLIDKVTAGFRGDVGVVPRQFFRHFVDVLDLVDADPGFNPMQEEGFTPQEPNEDEVRLMQGKQPYDPEPEDEEEYEEVQW